MTQATEIIGCLINGQNVSSRDIVYDRKIVAKAVFNGDNIYGYFSWVRIATSEILTFEEGSNIPFDAKTPYYANKDGFEFDLGTAPCGVAYFCQIGNGSNVLSSFIVSFRHEYLNTWTSIISPGWKYGTPDLGFDASCGISACNNVKNNDINNRQFYDIVHRTIVGEISEIQGGCGFSIARDTDGYSTGNNSGDIPDKYLKHYIFPTPQSTVPFMQGLSFSLPNGTYKVRLLSCINDPNARQGATYAIINSIDSAIFFYSYRKIHWWQNTTTLTIENGIIELILRSNIVNGLVPLNAIKLEKIA